MSIRDSRFWDSQNLDTEMRRVFQICHECRLCFKYCPSFPALFRAVDEKDGEVARLNAAEMDQVVDLCFQCKLCYVNCPYTPPHGYQLDFPRLMLRSTLVRKRAGTLSPQDRFLGNTDLSGAIGGLTAPLSNWANRMPLFRVVLEWMVGIHRQRWLPLFHRTSFDRWFRKRERRFRKTVAGGNGRVAFFHTCSINYNNPEIGRDAVAVLHHNDVEVVVPSQRCCGMPYLETGDLEACLGNLRENVRQLARLVDQGYTVVVPQPTCGYMLKEEYPWLSPDAETCKVAAHTMDLCEYLMSLHAKGALKTDFQEMPEKLAYHLPCHLKAQNIGYKSRDLLALIPGLKPRLVDRCSGMDGTWGMKKQFFHESLKVANKLIQEIDEGRPDRVASDCSLAGLQIRQGTGRGVSHPVQIVRQAYGLPESEA